MKFEIGKCYRHAAGEEFSIVGIVRTDMYGDCLVAESNENCDLKPVGSDESAAENWVEISRDEWLRNFYY